MTMLAAGQTIAQARRVLGDNFRQAGIDEAETDARLLIAHALNLDRSGLIVQGQRALTADEAEAINGLAARRLVREPVSRIFGVKEFWSLPLRVTDAVLVPRPDTETVVEEALDWIDRRGLRAAQLRILDIGTGSGAIILALLSELPHARGIAIDVSQAALDVARDNAERLGMLARCDFIACNITAPVHDAIHGPFDLIVSNPPYIAHDDIATLDPEVRHYDPVLALDGGIAGLDIYRSIAGKARDLLAPAGRLIVELGAGQEADVGTLMLASGLTVGPARRDLAGIARALSAAVAPEMP
ncbi:MAG: peptide chain release factor N(5)-glutamine methyltransferase [Rhodopseudomonas sp.]|nr:peptide chain release factor N(5)-glutamine methyltransferase [Rhodopseudomonas sp.]